MSAAHTLNHPSPLRWLKRLAQVFAIVLVMDGILFAAAGRLDWPGAWLLTFEYLAFLLLVVLWSERYASEMLQERSHVAANVKSWDRLIMSLYTILLLALLVVAGLDAGRFHWSDMPPALQAFGALAIIPLGAWLWWVITTNAFLSRFARIQDDRGQEVVTTGPYRYVRHPMYASLIPFLLCIALILGSWWALVPGAGIAVLFVIRTTLEDRMLRTELSGYEDYARRVRYRLWPGIW